MKVRLSITPGRQIFTQVMAIFSWSQDYKHSSGEQVNHLNYDLGFECHAWVNKTQIWGGLHAPNVVY